MSGSKYKDCEAHNLKVVGSNPAPATNLTSIHFQETPFKPYKSRLYSS